jgi:hypothetical protein
MPMPDQVISGARAKHRIHPEKLESIIELGVCTVLKKAGFVTATTAALMMVGGTAFAAPAETPGSYTHDDNITFSDAYYQFIDGGGALGYGAASLVAGAYTGIARTPHLILNPAGD